MVKIAVDAMGGDNAPGEIVAGAVMAAQSREDIQIFLIGKEEVVLSLIHIYNWKMSAPTLVKCSKCGALMMPHRVCKACGSYNKKEIVKVED